MLARMRSVNSSRSSTNASMNASHRACEPLSESETVTPLPAYVESDCVVLQAVSDDSPRRRIGASVTLVAAPRTYSGGPQMGNLAANLVTTAERHGDTIALRLDETEIPYAALDAA